MWVGGGWLHHLCFISPTSAFRRALERGAGLGKGTHSTGVGLENGDVMNLVSVKGAKLDILELWSLLIIHGGPSTGSTKNHCQKASGILCHLDVETSPDLVKSVQDFSLYLCFFFFLVLCCG